MIILLRLCGFLFLFIIVLSFSFEAFGNKIIYNFDSDVRLQKINDDPNKFKISIVLALLEHASVITLPIMLFIAFSSYNITLVVVGTIFRIVEGLILFYNEKNYWGLLNLARQYSGTSGAEKNSLSDLADTILKKKEFRFTFAQIFFSIGTMAYSILFITYGVVPPSIGWLGIVAGILHGFGAWIIIVKPNLKLLGYIGGLLVMVFEVILGGWLLFFS